MSVPVMFRRLICILSSQHATGELSPRKCPIPSRLVLCALGLLLCQRAQATLYLQDAINYSSGTQLGNNSPWANPNVQITVASGSLGYANLADIYPSGNMIAVAQGASGGYSYQPLSSIVSSGSVYYSFLVTCTTAPVSGSAYYIMGLLTNGVAVPGGRTVDPLTVYARTSGTSPQLGVTTRGAANVGYPTAVLALNTTYLVVVKYTFSTAEAALFINPTPGSSEPAPDVKTNGTVTAFNVANVYVRSQSSSLGNWNFDTLRIASTWAEVVPLPNQPPTIAPAGQPQSQTVPAGANVNFTVTVSGTPQFRYQWRKGGQNLGASIVSALNTNTLALSNVTTNDTADYDVVVTNSFGAITSAVASLTVNMLPGITLQPQAQTVCVAGTATFAAAAVGAPAPTVRWQVSTNAGGAWADIPDATSTTYSFTPLPGDLGKQYRAAFTNVAGSAYSLPAALTVSTPVAVNASANATQNQVLILRRARRWWGAIALPTSPSRFASPTPKPTWPAVAAASAFSASLAVA